MNQQEYIMRWGLKCQKQHRWTLSCGNPMCNLASARVDTDQMTFLQGLYASDWRLVSKDGNDPEPWCAECVAKHRRMKKQVEAIAIDVTGPDGMVYSFRTDPDKDVTLSSIENDESVDPDEARLAEEAEAEYYYAERAARGGKE